MPDISISEGQRERLQWVQSRLADDITYGHVRPCDALEYLLDRFDGTAAESDTTAAFDHADQLRHSTVPLANGAAGAVDDQGAASDRGETAVGDDATDESDGDDGDDGVTTHTDPETTLNSVMSLLEDNADVWRESSAGEEKYEVDLPDGSTERARTKDDVRALLFKHYR